MKHNKRGFTLIELLIVVLIIGILAAVAVPQYTLAVNKARFANLQTMTNALTKAARVYYLENNTYPSSFDEIALGLPGGFTPSSGSYVNCGTNDEMYCCFTLETPGAWAAAVSCGRKDYSLAAYHTFHDLKNFCVADQNDAAAVKLCKSFGAKTPTWNGIPTPDGIKTHHPYYEIK